MKVYKNKNGQAMPDKSQFFGPEAFQKINQTEIRWLGNASMMINSRGTNIMIDPLLEGFDMPLLIDHPKEIAHLLTHLANDEDKNDDMTLIVLKLCKQ